MTLEENHKKSRYWKEPLSDFNNIVELLEEKANEYGNKAFATFPQRTLRYNELNERSKKLAAGLSKRGLGTNDKIVVMTHNHPGFIELFFSSARVGAIIVPINVSLRGDDLSYALNDSDPEGIVVGSDCIEKYKEVKDDVSISMEISLEGDDKEIFDSFESLIIDENPDEVSPSQSDSLAIIYTSGTTGMPKGVVLPHGAFLNTATDLAERVIKPTEEDVFYMSQPLFHIFAQIVMVETLVSGSSLAMEKWFSKSKFWDRVEEYDATIIHFSSAISELLYKNTEARDNPVRVAYGAIADDTQRKFAENFDCKVVPLYGLTECGGIALSGTIDEPCTGSLGRSMEYTEITIADKDDSPVEPDEQGEILVRCTRPNTMFKEYHSKPSETVETLQNQWLHTGDIGYRDEDGDYHFVERESYFIRRMGENISAFEVERIIDDHPDVEKSTIAGVEAELAGEEVFAAVKLKDDSNLEPVEIIEHCEGRLAYFKIPRYVVFVDSFPTTETKETVQRFKLIDSYKQKAWDRQEAGYELER